MRFIGLEKKRLRLQNAFTHFNSVSGSTYNFNLVLKDFRLFLKYFFFFKNELKMKDNKFIKLFFKKKYETFLLSVKAKNANLVNF